MCSKNAVGEDVLRTLLPAGATGSKGEASAPHDQRQALHDSGAGSKRLRAAPFSGATRLA